MSAWRSTDRIASLAAGGGYLYWTTRWADRFHRVSVAVGEASHQTFPSPGSSGVAALAADDENVYWLELDFEGFAKANSRVMKQAHGGGPPSQLMFIADLAGDEIHVGPSAVFSWGVSLSTSPVPSGIFRVSLDGSSPSLLVDGVSGGRDVSNTRHFMAVSSGGVFWLDAALRMVPLDGGTPITLAPLPDADNWGLASDASNVYWACGEQPVWCQGHVNDNCAKPPVVCAVPTSGGTVRRLDLPPPVAIGRGGAFVGGSGWIAKLEADDKLRPMAGRREQPDPTLQPLLMAADAVNVYWVNATPVDGVSIRKLPIAQR